MQMSYWVILGDFNIDAFDPQAAIIEDKLHIYDIITNKPSHCWIKCISWKVLSWCLIFNQVSAMCTFQIMMQSFNQVSAMCTFQIMMQSKFTFSEEVFTWSDSLISLQFPQTLKKQWLKILVDKHQEETKASRIQNEPKYPPLTHNNPQ